MIGTVRGMMLSHKEVAGLPAPIASFRSNASGVKLDSLKVLVEAVQSGSGTPSPDNVRPITGWSGANVTRSEKNLFNNANPILGRYLNDSGSQILGSGWNISDYIPIKGGQTYHFKPNSTLGGSAYGFFYTDNSIDTTIQSSRFVSGEVTITAPNEARYVRFSYRDSSSNIQLELGSTATAYEPYNGNTYTISFGDTYYAGELNVTSGVFRVTHQIVDLGNLSYIYENTTTTGQSFGVMRTTLSPSPKINGDIICEMFKGVKTGIGSLQNNQCCISGTQSYPFLRIRCDEYTDATQFKTFVTGKHLVYELATPFTIQLTPQQIEQLEENNIWADTGDVSVCKYSDRVVTVLFSKG